MMKFITLIISLLYPIVGLSENLTIEDYPGKWIADWVAVKGESQSLVISKDLSTVFKRKMKGSEQIFKSKNIEPIDDYIVLNYKYNEGKMAYKIILSGWKVEKTKKLYGTMFMYQNGEQFNGLPVSFTSE